MKVLFILNDPRMAPPRNSVEPIQPCRVTLKG